MRILGLDLSLTSTGYCLLEPISVEEVLVNAELYGRASLMRVAWHGSVGSSTLRDVERLAMFDDWVREVLFGPVPRVEGPPPQQSRSAARAYPRRVDVVAIEGYSYGSPQAHTRAFGTGELGGVIKLAIHQAGIPTHIIASNTWKKVLCGKGGLKKDLVRLELFKRYGVEFASQDTLDAWAVAVTLGMQLLGLHKPEPKSRTRRPVSDGKSDTPRLEGANV